MFRSYKKCFILPIDLFSVACTFVHFSVEFNLLQLMFSGCEAAAKCRSANSCIVVWYKNTVCYMSYSPLC